MGGERSAGGGGDSPAARSVQDGRDCHTYEFTFSGGPLPEYAFRVRKDGQVVSGHVSFDARFLRELAARATLVADFGEATPPHQ